MLKKTIEKRNPNEGEREKKYVAIFRSATLSVLEFNANSNGTLIALFN